MLLAMRTLLAAWLLLAGLAPARGQAPPAAGETRRLEAVSRRFEAPPAEVRALREKGLEWREVEHALGISERTGKPVSELLKMREDGLGWGRIAVEHGLRLEDLKKDEPRR